MDNSNVQVNRLGMIYSKNWKQFRIDLEYRPDKKCVMDTKSLGIYFIIDVILSSLFWWLIFVFFFKDDISLLKCGGDLGSRYPR